MFSKAIFKSNQKPTNPLSNSSSYSFLNAPLKISRKISRAFKWKRPDRHPWYPSKPLIYYNSNNNNLEVRKHLSLWIRQRRRPLLGIKMRILESPVRRVTWRICIRIRVVEWMWGSRHRARLGYWRQLLNSTRNIRNFHRPLEGKTDLQKQLLLTEIKSWQVR